MRSGKASCTLETVWEDKHKYEEAERRFYEHEATQAAASAQQLPAEGPAMNGPGQDDPEDADEAEAPDGGSRRDPRKSQDSRKPLQKKRKRSPKSGLGPADLALLGLSAERVWLDKSLFDQAESSYRQKLADVAAQAAWPPALAPWGLCTHGNQVACHHVTWGIWVNKSSFDQAERAFVEWSQALLLAPDGSRRQGTPNTGQQVAVPDLAHQPSPPVNGQPPLGSLQALVREVWLEKPRYDAAERGFYEALFDGHPPGKVRLQERAGLAEGARRGRRDRRGRNILGNKRAGLRRADGEAPSALPYCYFLQKDAEAPWLSKPAYDSAECRHHAAEALRVAWCLEAASLSHRPGPRSGLSVSSLRPNRKMATNFLAHEKIWFDKFKYDDAERRFYEQMNGPVAGASRQSSGPGASSGTSGDHGELVVRIASLEVENQSLRGVVQELQQAISKLEARLNVLEKSSPGHRATAPQTQHVSPMRQVEPPAKKPATPAEDDEDDDIDLFGSDNEEEDKEAAQLREERLRQYAEKKAKKPALVAKSSILLDVKPWDDETDMAQLEACVRSIQLDGLVWGASKLVPVGYGIRKLQIQCVVEDDKVGTDLLEEEITKFEEHVQSVDIAAFNKI
ncbi:elongation factor 1-delta isoform X9 [Homo sapiens]|nr:elongation factor 1-delta isoform X9 [Homo sapiens]XP_047277404.1 elongation factor 1-delta isoform X9 [Homo sapiens]XP_047277405.1 elongation factor 1-delta isoform X9 [Homo sapiens]XP_047277406.1 elongation factor 1-delta isoform X9 [Homo sapiens]XP_047277407.1 elongation factor 1-delta isoform X9 [Homo sapiens]XP_047277408.1 elongation factor 1-delta isoform X9 [Homo sapiens]XP_047277409.1 elongation factor 1-delta isoform X9 [Homo sapiens]XP_054184716.1 elongation factor 1-delta isofo|eukprot:XP_006716583.2 elongation factor 1-delta isoform X3 [Homo sapiens]